MAQFLKNIPVKSDSQRLKEVIQTFKKLHFLCFLLKFFIKIKKVESERVNTNDFDNLEWLFPDSTMNFEKLTLAFKGFCAYALSHKRYLLLPSNPSIGVLQYNNNFYVFSSKKAAHEFAKNIQK